MSLASSRLEYTLAFDLACADWGGEPALAVVSTPEFVDLTLARACGGVLLWCEDDATLAHARERLAAGYLPVAARERSGAWLADNADVERPRGTVRHALWAAPRAATWSARLTTIERALTDGAALTLLSATWVGAALRPLRRGLVRGEPSAPIAPLRARLTSGAWLEEGATRLGGVVGVASAIAGRVASAAGRPDLADRAERAHHAAATSPVGASFQLTRVIRIGQEAVR